MADDKVVELVCRALVYDESEPEDCDFVFIQITPEVAKRILRLSGIVQGLKEDSVWKIEAFDYSHVFFGAVEDDSLDEFLREKLYSGGLFQTTNGEISEFVTEYHTGSIECACINVEDDGVVFDAYVKNTSIRVASETISIEVIRAIADGLPVDLPAIDVKAATMATPQE